jgi:hypothetical protein
MAITQIFLIFLFDPVPLLLDRYYLTILSTVIAGRNAGVRFLRTLIGGQSGLFRVEQVKAEEEQSGWVWVSFDNILCTIPCYTIRL